MTNPRDPEGLMPDATDEAGPPVDRDGALPGGTDTDELVSDPDVRFPGESEGPTMATADAMTAPVTAEPAHSEAEDLDPDVDLRNPGG